MGNRLINVVQKKGSQLFLPFSKLKVFLQILIIIVVMMVFLIMQGYSSLKFVAKMQNVTTDVFNDSSKGYSMIYTLKDDLKEVQINYLKELVRGSRNIAINTFNPNQIEFLKKLDPTEAAGIETELVKINALLKQPLSVENYNKLNDIMIFVVMGIKNFESQINTTASDTMNLGKEYSRASTLNSLIMLFFSLLISLGLGLMVAVSISIPLKVMAKTAVSMAEGDLSREVNARGCYEATVTVNGLNNAISVLRNLIAGINREAETILLKSKGLRDTASDSDRAAHEVSKAMEELIRASSEQSAQIVQTVTTINELSELVRKVSEDTSNIASISGKMADSAKLGQKVTGAVTNEINEIYRSTKDVEAVIHELDQTSGEISKITNIIGGLAEQTTLLALNAAIEAARAGEYGKGFGVVASETGKLAEQSKQSAKMIAQLLSQMTSKTGQAVDAIQNGMAKAEAGKTLASEAAVTFENIFREQQDVLSQINVVAMSAREMAEKSNSVIGAINSVATISEENLASTEEVSAISQEQTAAARGVSDMAENLADIANKLKKSIAVFDTGARS